MVPTAQFRSGSRSSNNSEEEWSKCLLRYTDQGIGNITTLLEEAAQKEGQHPTSFHNYLDSLEKQKPTTLDPDPIRALYYFGKLTSDLRAEIKLRYSKLPTTRVGMVEAATRVWKGNKELQRLQKKRKKGAAHPEGAPLPKRHSNGKFRPQNTPSFQTKIPPPVRTVGESPAKQEQNPVSQDGQIMRCHICNSQYHLLANCPNKTKVQRALWWESCQRGHQRLGCSKSPYRPRAKN